MSAMSNMAERKLQVGSQEPIVLPEGGAINDDQARAIYTQTDCWCIIRPLRRSRQKIGKYPVTARELAIQGPVEGWEEAERLAKEDVKKNGKTGAKKPEAEKMLEKIKIEARKKAKRSKESKWNGKNTTRHTAQHTWWGKTWPQNPEPLPVSNWCFAPGAWMPFGEYFSATCRRGQYLREARELAIPGHATKKNATYD